MNNLTQYFEYEFNNVIADYDESEFSWDVAKRALLYIVDRLNMYPNPSSIIERIVDECKDEDIVYNVEDNLNLKILKQFVKNGLFYKGDEDIFKSYLGEISLHPEEDYKKLKNDIFYECNGYDATGLKYSIALSQKKIREYLQGSVNHCIEIIRNILESSDSETGYSEKSVIKKYIDKDLDRIAKQYKKTGIDKEQKRFELLKEAIKYLEENDIDRIFSDLFIISAYKSEVIFHFDTNKLSKTCVFFRKHTKDSGVILRILHESVSKKIKENKKSILKKRELLKLADDLSKGVVKSGDKVRRQLLDFAIAFGMTFSLDTYSNDNRDVNKSLFGDYLSLSMIDAAKRRFDTKGADAQDAKKNDYSVIAQSINYKNYIECRYIECILDESLSTPKEKWDAIHSIPKYSNSGVRSEKGRSTLDGSPTAYFKSRFLDSIRSNSRKYDLGIYFSELRSEKNSNPDFDKLNRAFSIYEEYYGKVSKLKSENEAAYNFLCSSSESHKYRGLELFHIDLYEFLLRWYSDLSDFEGYYDLKDILISMFGSEYIDILNDSPEKLSELDIRNILLDKIEELTRDFSLHVIDWFAERVLTEPDDPAELRESEGDDDCKPFDRYALLSVFYYYYVLSKNSAGKTLRELFDEFGGFVNPFLLEARFHPLDYKNVFDCLLIIAMYSNS